jgi:hypothetical protein
VFPKAYGHFYNGPASPEVRRSVRRLSSFQSVVTPKKTAFISLAESLTT